jgi:hypothetical protein
VGEQAEEAMSNSDALKLAWAIAEASPDARIAEPFDRAEKTMRAAWGEMDAFLLEFQRNPATSLADRTPRKVRFIDIQKRCSETARSAIMRANAEVDFNLGKNRSAKLQA